MYGWAFCSCLYFTATKGACKHLWAMRLSMPELVTSTDLYPAQYVFKFPVTTPPPSLSSSSTTAGIPSASNSQLQPLFPNLSTTDPNANMTASLQTISSMANTWLMNTMEQTDNQSDNEDSLSMATSDSMSDHDECSAGGMYEYANYEAIHHQVVDKLEHTVYSMLPQLHGIISLLKDEDASPQSAKLSTSAELHELQETCARLEMMLSRIIGKGK
ncbi:hypothetical protein JB92DRAFT_3219491 [Gautieria morchelliformis]|nr:hypothetical protein JB92DRAFT_3219491 [Gautieria morchelliformis]